MYVTPAGISMSARELQSVNALSPMPVSPSGSRTVVIMLL